MYSWLSHHLQSCTAEHITAGIEHFSPLTLVVAFRHCLLVSSILSPICAKKGCVSGPPRDTFIACVHLLLSLVARAKRKKSKQEKKPVTQQRSSVLQRPVVNHHYCSMHISSTYLTLFVWVILPPSLVASVLVSCCMPHLAFHASLWVSPHHRTCFIMTSSIEISSLIYCFLEVHL